MKPIALLFAGFLIATLALTSTSCQKNTDCKASVKVIDSLGIPVNNASVLLFATIKTSNGGTVTADVKASAVTDAGGEVKFTFKLPAIYDIRATLITSAPSRTLVGTGIIKLEEGKGADKTVTLR
ncbi:MAG: hypothetical protein Q7W45_05820 [Bacteroidota bacterium]|nr:hypothetical protein [Bacteroidota bacterium]MDP3144964.1 hypothetical protein [Bacteroidota bacterium]MDP3555996.1 hypothetical protein [Bacteroidota bacterium]